VNEAGETYLDAFRAIFPAQITAVGSATITEALTGTITSSGATVTGAGTLFAEQVDIGDLIGTNSLGFFEVVSIASDTSLTLLSAPGTAFSGQAPSVQYSVAAYGWEEQAWWPKSGMYQPAVPGRTGSPTLCPAYEINNLPTPVGTYVWLRLRAVIAGVPTYEFANTGPPGVVVFHGSDSSDPDGYTLGAVLQGYLYDCYVDTTNGGSGIVLTVGLPDGATLLPGWHCDVRLANGDSVRQSQPAAWINVLGYYQSSVQSTATISYFGQVVRCTWTGLDWDYRISGMAFGVAQNDEDVPTSWGPTGDIGLAGFAGIAWPSQPIPDGPQTAYAVTLCVGASWQTALFDAYNSEQSNYSPDGVVILSTATGDGNCNCESDVYVNWTVQNWDCPNSYITLRAGNPGPVDGVPDQSRSSYIIVDGFGGWTGTDSVGNQYRGGIMVSPGSGGPDTPSPGTCGGSGSSSGSSGGGGGCGCCDSIAMPTLTATVTDATGCLTSLPSTFTLTSTGGAGCSWTGSALAVCGGEITPIIECNPDVYGHDPILFFNTAFGAVTGYTCSPFSAVYNVSITGGESGTATITVVS
jgi:hypothetical protein